MQFHKYISMRNRVVKYEEDAGTRERAKEDTSLEYRESILRAHLKMCRERGPNHVWDSDELMLSDETDCAFSEESWAVSGRPFYNVWPIVLEMAREVKLDIPISSFKPPFESLVLSVPHGHEPSDITTALICWPKNECKSFCFYFTPDYAGFRGGFNLPYDESKDFESWLSRVRADGKKYHEGQESIEDNVIVMMRLLVLIGFLANDHDLITPIVLSKDQAKYDSAESTDVKEWLENRAAKRQGRGFDFGKKLTEAREASPHWRNPHLCLFWIGTGRKTPVIKLRRGTVIQRVDMSNVPTGFLGPETSEDDLFVDSKATRAALSKRERFEILKRDGYMCQICGRSQRDGVKLHVDHIVPVSAGGSNDRENLQALCEDCNLGKSNLDY